MSDDLKELVFKHDTTPKPGWPCPNCGGMGSMCDGSLSIGPTETRFKPPSKCYVCNGKGRVLVTAIPD